MKKQNVIIGCSLVGVLGLLFLFVMLALVAKGCHGCATGGPYGMVTEAATTDSRVSDAVGGIVQVGAMPSGSINYNNGEGYAEMVLFIDGVDRDGEYQAVCRKPSGADEWMIETAVVVLEDGNVVELEPPVQGP